METVTDDEEGKRERKVDQEGRWNGRSKDGRSETVRDCERGQMAMTRRRRRRGVIVVIGARAGLDDDDDDDEWR